MRLSLLLTLAFAVWQMVWALVSPAFRTPDEPIHLNSVLRLASTQGGWPDPAQARVDTAVVNATVQAGLIEEGGADYSLINRTDLLGSPHAEATQTDYYANLRLPGRTERSVITYGENSSDIVDQMTQHPPLYYALAAGFVKITGATHWQWDRQLLLLRFFSIFLTLPVLPCLLYVSRTLGASRRGALAVGSTIIAVAQYSFITASVSNDSLTFTAGALTMAALARAMTGQGARRDVLFLGLALGLGLWTKGTFIPMGAVVGLAFMGNSRINTWRARLGCGVVSGAVGLAMGGFWWMRNLVKFGAIQPEGMQRPHVGTGSDNWHFLETAVKNLADSSWGKLGWLEWTAPEWLLKACIFFVLLTVFISVALGPMRYEKIMLVLYQVLAGGMIIFGAWNGYRADGVIAGVQGRYLFPGLVGLLAVSACAWLPLLRKSRRWTYAIPGAISAAIGLSVLVGWWKVCYTSMGHWSAAVGFNLGWLVVLLIVGAGAVAVMVVAPVCGVDSISASLNQGRNRRFSRLKS